MRAASKPWIAMGLTVLGVAAVGMVLRYRHPHYNSGVVDRDELARADRANLSRKGAADSEIYGALVRLAQQGDPEARTVAIERKGDPSTLVRSGVAQAMGYYEDDEAFAVGRGLLSDPQLVVRLQAIQGMTHRPAPRRKSAIRDMLARPTITGDERAAIAAAMLALQPTADERDQAISVLVGLTEDSAAKRDPSVAKIAAISMISAAPTDPRVEDALRGFLQRGTLAPIHDIAIRHLASARDPWLRANFRRLEVEHDPGVRLAVVQSMHLACPADRWQTLDWAIAEGSGMPPVAPGRPPRADNVRLAAIQEVGTMGGPNALIFLEKAIQGAKFSDPLEIAKAREMLNDLRQNPKNYPDRCAGFPVATSRENSKEMQ